MSKLFTLTMISSIKHSILSFSFVHLTISAAIGPAPTSLPYRCTESPNWVGSGYSMRDCSATVSQFYSREAWVFGSRNYEFMGENAHRAHRPLIPQSLPKKFTFGTCTLAISMLNFFPDGSLPGGEVGPFVATDVASYEDIYFAARSVNQECVYKNDAPGFKAVGLDEAVGVFLWATDSLENEMMRGSALNLTTPTPGTRPSEAANISGSLDGHPLAGGLSSTS